jgi:hypothetical protein
MQSYTNSSFTTALKNIKYLLLDCFVSRFVDKIMAKFKPGQWVEYSPVDSTHLAILRFFLSVSTTNQMTLCKIPTDTPESFRR